MHISPEKVGTIHFIGIGGIGMSGIAEVLLNLGFIVSGSDLSENNNIKRLIKLGAKIFLGHDETNVKDAEVVVVSSAIKPNNPELYYARKRNLPVLQRAEMLAELMRLKKSIVVAGSHGKTTTTSLLANLLDCAQFDPTIVNGGIINAYGSNARLGKGKWIVVEADESDGSFTKLPSTIGVVTNIDPEHMDHFGTFDHLVNSFMKFIHNIPFYGLAVLCIDHPEVAKLIEKGIDRRYVTYGFLPDAQIRADNIEFTSEGVKFDVLIQPRKDAGGKNVSLLPRKIGGLFISAFGRHNVQNALTMVAVAQELGFSDEILKNALSSFQGVKRRFTKVGEVNGITFIDDYAHHPVEIQAVVNTALEVQKSKGRIIGIMQPHRYTRLRDLMDQFAESLLPLDRILVCPVYTAGETQIEGVSSTILAEKIRQKGQQFVTEVTGYEDILAYLKENLIPGDMVIGLGAGNITQWVADLFKDYSIDRDGHEEGTEGLALIG